MKKFTRTVGMALVLFAFVTLVPVSALAPGQHPWEVYWEAASYEPVEPTALYVNAIYGYRFEYGMSWYLMLDGEPRRVSFSTLYPGRYARDDMRDQGCLIEISELGNPYGFTLEDVRAQMPMVFAGAQPYKLDGASGLRMQRTGDSFDSDWMLVEHRGSLFLISAEYGGDACEIGRSAWENLLETWTWLDHEAILAYEPSHG